MRVPAGNRYAPLVVAAAAMELGKVEQGKRVMAEFLARNPGYSVANLKATWPPTGLAPRSRQERYLALLRAAGLPEG
jgi:hypothetical protein